MGNGRKQQILDTAAGLFAERGFHGVSVHDIGTAIGVSGPALYRHFDGKDAILAEMLVDISNRLLDEGGRRVESASTALESLQSLVDWHVDFALTYPSLIVVQEREWANLPEKIQDTVRATQLAYIDLWVTALRTLRPELDVRSARAAAQAAFGLINSTPHSARIGRPAMRDLLTEMAVAALLGRAASGS
ncbi:TetR/AcrR family transcriptional regulator [Solicola gregarius]|uniref:TetR/AcrR family transcriptional regulator n=1 Tax=Solicola gregarius TaxID=2908642 RepID=A0AA46TM13_9ACTN|nr:TetR/AcrR family transcriptional regulator [Solicola gregarius]UYM07535.1 TetR/AcrR family transcriptional regulator [Solicola gregarius]